ncbi:hypothetical protein BOX15_Mlig023985g2 [Macrostomum lignano]|uniref:Cation-transporting ATPase n=1 Tax=Macrostomum lignano TaxID=282301 RepID=A0A267GIP1_9PLAT|nr:hypothetical protein BOX15_Mlig023985g2 [Macrostomum lignano]
MGESSAIFPKSEGSGIAYVSLLRSHQVVFHGYVFPFAVMYLLAMLNLAFFRIYGSIELGFILIALIAILNILVCLSCYWSVHIKALLCFSKVTSLQSADVIKVVPIANNGSPEIVKLEKQTVDKGSTPYYWFLFQKEKFFLTKDSVQPLQFPVDKDLSHYLSSKGMETESELQQAVHQFGTNNMEMVPPKFSELFIERATAPFFVFQVFCVGLWCLDDYWYYSLFTLGMLVVFECTLVQQQLRNMAEIRQMGNKPYPIYTLRNKKWNLLDSSQLVPGDLVSLGRSEKERLIPCDLLLLRGQCIVDESMLTGESVPVTKEPAESILDDRSLCLDTDAKHHVLSGGTKVVQHTPPQKVGAGTKSPDNGCICYVLRNGFQTSQGRLLKTILFGVKRVTANNLETFLFISFLLVFALAASAYVWLEGTKDPKRSRYKLFLECTLIITSVVPPELPIELSLAVQNSLVALHRLFIYCTEPFRIPFAGKVDICCFDKTGTLTRDEMMVDGVAGLDSDNPNEIQTVQNCGQATVQVMAACHSLVIMDKTNDLLGDPLEKAILKATGWTLTKGEAVIPPSASRAQHHPLKVFVRFHFSSSLQRMATVAGHTPLGSTDTHYMVCAKGAPERLKEMLIDPPPFYDKVSNQLAKDGFRVLALAYRQLGTLNHQDLRALKRADVERDLTFCGFLAVSCPLRSTSKSVVRELLSSSHHVCMITGDNPYTACHVAKQLKIARQPLLSLSQTGQDWSWTGIDNDSDCLELDLKLAANKPKRIVAELLKQHSICLTGEALDYLRLSTPKLLPLLLPAVSVFARMKPKQKELIVTVLKDRGYATLMCGDGTNDVGALKHAHVGVAIFANAPETLPSSSAAKTEPAPAAAPARRQPEPQPAPRDRAEAQRQRLEKAQRDLNEMLKEADAPLVRPGDATIAAPFSYKLASVTCVCNIVKQGRCTLVTTLQMFKILAINALIYAYSQSVLYLDGVKFSDGQATLQGLVLAACFLFISRSKPLTTLSARRPLPNIFNAYTLLTVFLQFVIHFASLIFLTREAKALMPQLKEGEFVDLEAEFKPNILNSVVYLISISMQINAFAVNYKGHPFMESLMENKPLLYSITTATGLVFSLASGYMPELCEQFSLVEIDNNLRNTIVQVLAADFVGCFVVDRLCDLIFGRGRAKRLV